MIRIIIIVILMTLFHSNVALGSESKTISFMQCDWLVDSKYFTYSQQIRHLYYMSESGYTSAEFSEQAFIPFENIPGYRVQFTLFADLVDDRHILHAYQVRASAVPETNAKKSNYKIFVLFDSVNYVMFTNVSIEQFVKYSGNCISNATKSELLSKVGKEFGIN